MTRDVIIESNKAVNSLESAGFICQGRTRNFKQISVIDKNGENLFFDSYIIAAKQLLN